MTVQVMGERKSPSPPHLCRDLVLVRPYYDPDKVGRIDLPYVAKNPMSQHGRVLATGPQQYQVRVGEVVVYRAYVAEPVRLKGEEYLIVRDHDLVCIIRDGELWPLEGTLIVLPDFQDFKKLAEDINAVPEDEDASNFLLTIGKSAERLRDEMLRLLLDVKYLKTTPRTQGTCVCAGINVHGIARGARILYAPNAGFEIAFRNTIYYIIRGEDVIARYTDEQDTS